MKINFLKSLSRSVLVLLCIGFTTVYAQQPKTKQTQTQPGNKQNTNQQKTTNPQSTQGQSQQGRTPGTQTVDPSKLTPEQIKQALEQRKNDNTQNNTTDQIDPQAKEKQETADATDEDVEQDKKDENQELEAKGAGGVKGTPGLPIFGNEIFTGAGSNFAPNANRPTPLNYILGPGDVLNIDVTGNSVVSWELAIAPDGSIMLPGMGKLFLGGKTIENGTIAIENKLRANRFAIGNGTDVSVTLANIRSIRITMMGEVRSPGDKTVSSLTTVFNALHDAGGITDNGSYRAIELIRDNQIISIIDMYNYLLTGDLSSNVQLKDGDVIRVPIYRVRVSMEGEVKRARYFEILPGESLRDVVNFAGGFSDYAYKFNIKAVQLTDREQKLRDIPFDQLESYIPLKGDKYMVARILDRYENRVSIAGAVYRPGDYELKDGATLKELIERVDGLREDAYTDRAYITRLNEDNTSQVIPFNVKAIMDGTEPDIRLLKEDVIQISSIFDYADQYSVSINGAVRKSGTFSYYNGITVDDLILSAGGFADGANKVKVQVSRRVKDSDRMAKDAKLANILDVVIDPELKLSSAQFKLEPFDVVTVFTIPGFVKMQVVTVTGEVMNPGGFAMMKKDDRISDILQRAGGFTAYANLKDATFRRNGRVGNIRIEEVMNHPGSKRDIILLDGDTITIPAVNQLLTVRGAVQMPMSLVFESHSLLDNVNKSGGFAENARKKGAFVRYANGSVKGTKSFLFFRNYPNVEPGSEIFIPFEQPKEKKDGAQIAQTWVGLSASLASVAAIIFAVINNNK